MPGGSAKQTREEIVEAAVRLVRIRAPTTIRTRDIAHEANVSAALIIQYFGTLRGALCAALALTLRERADAIAMLAQTQPPLTLAEFDASTFAHDRADADSLTFLLDAPSHRPHPESDIMLSFARWRLPYVAGLLAAHTPSAAADMFRAHQVSYWDAYRVAMRDGVASAPALAAHARLMDFIGRCGVHGFAAPPS